MSYGWWFVRRRRDRMNRSEDSDGLENHKQNPAADDGHKDLELRRKSRILLFRMLLSVRVHKFLRWLTIMKVCDGAYDSIIGNDQLIVGLNGGGRH